VLTRLADSQEKTREFRGKVTGAMIYPAIISIGMIVVMIIMMVVVVPKLTSLYQDFNAELPLATRILMGISNIFLHYWWAVIIVAGGVIFAVVSYLRTAAGKRTRDKLIFSIPIWGMLSKQIMLTELTRTLALLVSAGVPIVEDLDIVAAVVGNIIIEEDVRRVARQVEKGFPVSIAFSESPFFPPIVGQMIAVGEETGKMDEVLDKLSYYFESESDLKVKGLTTAIEPLIIMVLAVGVGFLMYAVIMPIYDITNKI
jgi:type II secretory pathway component PulF